MDTSNSMRLSPKDLDFKTIDLLHSQDPGDMENAKQAEAIIRSLIEQLKPILRYIAKPYTVQAEGNSGIEIRLIPLCTFFLPNCGYLLQAYLTSDGRFVRSLPKKKGESELDGFSKDDDCWRYCNFRELVESIEKAVTNAQKERKEHLAAIERRTSILTAMLCIVDKRGIQD